MTKKTSNSLFFIQYCNNYYNSHDRYVPPRGVAVDSGIDSRTGDRESRVIIRHDPRKHFA